MDTIHKENTKIFGDITFFVPTIVFLQICLQFMYEKEGLTTNTRKYSYIRENTIQ